MRIISFIEDMWVIREILQQLGPWLVRSRPPPKIHDPITLLVPKAPDQHAHSPHQHADCYADPEYTWDEYIQS
jgi:hypothetical protein